MASKYDGINPELERALEASNSVFAAVFNVEMILKLFGMGW
jgi:hypothetical protein